MFAIWKNLKAKITKKKNSCLQGKPDGSSHSGSVNEILCQIMQAHGVEAEVKNDWVVAGPDHPAIRGVMFQPKQGMVGSLQVHLPVPGSGMLVEAFAGIGQTNEARLANAFDNFSKNSLHVLLSAFFDHPQDDQVDKDTWTFDGVTWDLYLGPAGVRLLGGDAKGPLEHPQDFQDTLRAIVENNCRSSSDIHWVRLFHFHADSASAHTDEVLIDNQVCLGSQTALGNMAWSDNHAPYSFRNFLVLKKQGMAKIQYPDVVTITSGFTDLLDAYGQGVDLDQHLVNRGFDRELAHRLDIFAPMACFMAMFPEAKAPTRYHISQKGDIVATRRFIDEPVYMICMARAVELLQRADSHKQVTDLALTSAYVSCLNQAAEAGHHLDNIQDFNFGEPIILQY